MSLAGWDPNKKIQLTIDPADVPANLTDFPVLVNLSTSSGKTGFDASAVFTELGANSKKIAFEIGNTGNQCYAEIEFWDNANSKAVLHVKVPSILAASGAVLNLYYDSTHTDNTTYIGNTGSVAAQSVWDSNFVAVYHMAQDPSGTAPQILDSTSNVNHGTSYGSMTSSDLIDGLTGKAIDFDGSDDYTNHGYSSELDITDTMTIDVAFAPSTTIDNTVSNYPTLVSRQHIPTTGEDSYAMYFSLDGALYYATNGGNIGTTKDVWQGGTYFVISSTYNVTGLLANIFVDGLVEVPTGIGVDTMSGSLNDLLIGANLPSSGQFFNGAISEVRISNIVRSDAWIAATNQSLRDNLVTFSVAQTLLRTILKQFYTLHVGDDFARQLCDQQYACAQFARQLCDQQYRATDAARQLSAQIYGLLLQTALRQPYGCAPVITAVLRQYYSSASLPRSAVHQPYACALQIRQQLEQPYSYPGILRHALEQRYSLSAGQIRRVAEQRYNISEIELARSVLNQHWGLYPDGSSVQAVQATVTINGVEVDFHHVSIEGNTDQYCLTCELHLTREADYMQARVMDELVIYLDQDYVFFIESMSRNREHGTAEYRVNGLSPSALLAEPYSEPVTTELSGMASDIIQQLAPGYTIDYRAIDWYIPGNTLLPGNDSPMRVIGNIAAASSSVVQTTPDGTIIVEPRYQVSPSAWKTATTAHTYSDMLDFFSVAEEFDHRPGYNKYVISDQAESQETVRIEDETKTETEHIIRVYQTPWQDDFEVRHTGGDWVTVEPLEIDEREIIDEIVEFVSGDGQTQYPIYAVTAQEWLQQPLGAITISEDGILQAAVEAESLLKISYQTKCRRYRVTDGKAEPVQLVAEGSDG